jgi:hypothetical protein
VDNIFVEIGKLKNMIRDITLVKRISQRSENVTLVKMIEPIYGGVPISKEWDVRNEDLYNFRNVIKEIFSSEYE